MPNQYQSPDLEHNGFLVMLQGFLPERIMEVSPGRWRMEINAGEYYSDSDRDNGRIRAEMRLKTPCVLGEWNTFSYTIDRSEMPIWGMERNEKVTQGQFFYQGSNPRPPYWIETLGTDHGIFLNSYASGPEGLERLPFPEDRQRVCHEVRPYADGTLELRISIDGTVVFALSRSKFENSFAAEVFFKLGLYISRGAGHLNDPMPRMVCYYENVRFHQGEATNEDLLMSVIPPAPTEPATDPQPEPEPVPAPTPDPVQEPTPTAPPEQWTITGSIGPVPFNLTIRKG